MTTIKSFTDISQSKKLAEILPLESADMYWQSNLNSSDRQYLLDMGEEEYFDIEMNFEHCSIGDYDVPAWSLAALLGVFPYYEINNNRVNIELSVKGETFITEKGEGLLDLAVNMIIHLHELKLL